MPNRLVNESSPYLQQHAHNPVDWYPWGDEALQRAVKEDKPILVSIGYAACHWCHVMERESFEDPATAAYMNEHFINIKIDREERPDLDHIYMDAVQAISGSGGWPLNVFLTPDARPFYGGTYFPPRPAFNRASWMDVLKSVQQAFSQKRSEMDAQAENLTEHIRRSGAWGGQGGNENPFTPDSGRQVAEALLATADRQWGGFGAAPKFPQTFSITYLLRYYHQCLLENRDPGVAKQALDQALLSLDKMIEGGIYDQAGGGFARYSTDREWLAPHFEKMLYDNALLVLTLCEAYQLTRHDRYAEVIHETLAFVNRELSETDSGGFYSALDADSEGEEGKFYVWSEEEVKQVLGADAGLFCNFYDISAGGNWEGRNILRVRQSPEDFAAANGIGVAELKALLQNGREKLMERRAARTRPLLDDKSILGWNALMNAAFCRAYAATGHAPYLERAKENMDFLLKNYRKENGQYHHTWKKGIARFPAFLDDLAFLINALLELQEVSAEPGWLEEARSITEEVSRGFSDERDLFFYFTRVDQQDVILRKKEVYDGALPSGNAMMASNLLKLGLLLDETGWRERATAMVSGMGQAIMKYPGSFGHWAAVFLLQQSGVAEIAITGPEMEQFHRHLLQKYLPHRVLQASLAADENYPLIRQKEMPGKTAIWLCRNYTCQQPVFSVEALITLINKGAKG